MSMVEKSGDIVSIRSACATIRSPSSAFETNYRILLVEARQLQSCHRCFDPNEALLHARSHKTQAAGKLKANSDRSPGLELISKRIHVASNSMMMVETDTTDDLTTSCTMDSTIRQAIQPYISVLRYRSVQFMMIDEGYGVASVRGWSAPPVQSA